MLSKWLRRFPDWNGEFRGHARAAIWSAETIDRATGSRAGRSISTLRGGDGSSVPLTEGWEQTIHGGELDIPILGELILEATGDVVLQTPSVMMLMSASRDLIGAVL